MRAKRTKSSNIYWGKCACLQYFDNFFSVSRSTQRTNRFCVCATKSFYLAKRKKRRMITYLSLEDLKQLVELLFLLEIRVIIVLVAVRSLICSVFSAFSSS